MWDAQAFTESFDNIAYRILFGLATAYFGADILSGEHHAIVSRLWKKAGRNPWPDK